MQSEGKGVPFRCIFRTLSLLYKGFMSDWNGSHRMPGRTSVTHNAIKNTNAPPSPVRASKLSVGGRFPSDPTPADDPPQSLPSPSILRSPGSLRRLSSHADPADGSRCVCCMCVCYVCVLPTGPGVSVLQSN